MRIFTLSMALSLSLIANYASAAFVIDDFSDDQDFLTTPSMNINLVGVPTTADRTGTESGGDGANINNDYEVTAGIFRINQQSSTSLTAASYSLLYDNFGTGTIDVLDGGANEGFIFTRLGYTNNAPAPNDLEFTITVTAPESSTSLLIVQPKFDMHVFVPFASFSPAFDFSNVSSIEISTMSPGGGNQNQLQFDSLEVGVVPEPASMALMGLGSLLAGCGVVRRRRKQSSELVA